MSTLKKKNILNKVNNNKTLRSTKCFAGTDGISYTCYSTKCLVKIANDWNKFVDMDNEYNKLVGGEENNKLIKLDDSNKIKNIDKLSKKELWKSIDQINTHFYNCKTEFCWTTLPYIRSKSTLLKRFRPIKPRSWLKDNNTWLNTTDIENVMYQYENRYPDFKFLGVSPVDYDFMYSNECVSEEICKLDIKELYNSGIRKIGMVFNLDRHDEPGSHWVSLFSDFNRGEIYYYDSYGLRPPFDIRRLIKEISVQGKNILDHDQLKNRNYGYCLDNCDLNQEYFTSYFNDVRHQYKNSECGVFSMHFIISFLEGLDFEENITTNKKTDDEINKYRDIYYHNMT